jgi:NADH-quinone oxidoreductase subunit J
MALVDLFTLLFAVLGVASAALVAFHPNILYAAVALVFSLLSVAGFYGILGADFLLGAQLIIYVGGIIVVILFAIMMSEHINKARFFEGAKKMLFPALVSIVSMVGLLKLVNKIAWPKVETLSQAPTTQAMGRALVGPYALVFQYVAIVLLAGLVGAVIVARPHHHEDEKTGSEK